MPSKPFIPQPNFRTAPEDLNKVERFKLESNMTRGDMRADFRNADANDIQADTEQLAKSHGIYLEYNRHAKGGAKKDWMYMVRVSIPGGGGFDAEKWRVFDDVANRFAVNPEGRPSIRLTTRQNIQYHWVKKQDVIPLVQAVASTGFYTLNGCGDNFRNVMGCPLSRYSTVFDATAWARNAAQYFQLPAEPHIEVFEVDPNHIRTPDEHFEYAPNLLNRKFKVGFGAIHRDEQSGEWLQDNCVEMRTNEIGVAPIPPGSQEGDNARVDRFMLYVGGGQGEKNGKPTFTALGKPFGVVTEDNLLKCMDAIVAVHQEWGDRQNRHWARLKYVVHHFGVDWYRERVRERGAEFEDSDGEVGDHFKGPGPRMLHHGWQTQPSNGKLAFGCYIENGRLIDGGNSGGEERLKSMVTHVLDTFAGIDVLITPNQDLLFCNVEPDAKDDLEAALREHGWGQRNGQAYSTLRKNSGACVGLHTCRLAYTESEGFEPELLDQLDAMGYGDLNESIGITGCERQCFRPSTKTLGWVGQGPDLYELKVGGSEDGSTQGHALVSDGQWYLRRVPRDRVATVSAVLFDHYQANRNDETETMGQFHQRVGPDALIAHLKGNEKTADLMSKSYDAPFIPAE